MNESSDRCAAVSPAHQGCEARNAPLRFELQLQRARLLGVLDHVHDARSPDELIEQLIDAVESLKRSDEAYLARIAELEEEVDELEEMGFEDPSEDEDDDENRDDIEDLLDDVRDEIESCVGDAIKRIIRKRRRDEE